MSGAAQEPARLAEDLAFFGRVTASTTHQINNVLAIVGELNGLLEDVARLAGEGPLPPGKLEDVLARSQRQVERGVDYLDRLNAFAHAVDVPVAEIDLAAAVAGLTALAGRMAQLKRATLVFAGGEEGGAAVPGPRLRTRPFRLLRAVYLGIEAALVGGGRGRQVTVAVRPAGGDPDGGAAGPAAGDAGDAAGAGARIEIASSEALAPDPEAERALAAMRELAAELGGGLEVTAGPAARIVLRLPGG